MKKLIILLLISTSFATPAQVHKGLTGKQLRAAESKIIKTLGRYPEMFLPYKSQSERKIKLERVSCSQARVNLYFNTGLLQVGIREQLCLKWEDQIRSTLGESYKEAKIGIFANSIPIERLVPNLYRHKIARDSKRSATPMSSVPLVKSLDEVTFGKGLSYRTLALWASHGKYMDIEDTTWKFQRPALFTTIEDIHTYYLLDTYLIPMLENSGAVVVTPRERDTNPREIIIDNDNNTQQLTLTGDWNKVSGGFKAIEIIRNENPFKTGTSLISNGLSGATYTTKIDSSGKYAVYVSYKANHKNTNRALYTIFHKGGQSKFEVNQTIGGGWVYLGKFNFKDQAKITLSGKGQISTDAIKIGGGMGNVERKGELSNAPRWAEAAKYFMQYNGVDKEIFVQEHDSKKESDYMDDYKSRGDWVNYIKNEQKIPVDLAFTLHTNSGVVDSIFGTLAIHHTDNGKGTYQDGKSKYAGRDFCDIVLTQVVDDIRALYDTTWVRRSMYDKSYAEISRPDVPAIMLEVFSHQNYNDINYALDPNFRFDVCRAIYKGILKFISDRYSTKYEVQPLPVHDVTSKVVGSKLKVSWDQTLDPLEPSAKPKYYMFYTVKDDVLSKGTRVETNFIEIEIPQSETIFKIIAYNDGGKSFDIDNHDFDPKTNQIKTMRLPIRDYSIVGVQTDHDKKSQFVDNAQPGYGASDLSLLFEGVMTTY